MRQITWLTELNWNHLISISIAYANICASVNLWTLETHPIDTKHHQITHTHSKKSETTKKTTQKLMLIHSFGWSISPSVSFCLRLIFTAGLTVLIDSLLNCQTCKKRLLFFLFLCVFFYGWRWSWRFWFAFQNP